MTHLNVRVQVVHENLILFFKHFASIHNFKTIGPAHENIGTNHARELESLRCSHAQRMDVDYGSNRNLEL